MELLLKKIADNISSLFKINTRWLTIILPMFLLGIFFLILTLNNVYTEIYDIERFNRAKESIRSPITIENELETRRKVREAVQSIEDRYDIQEEILEERTEYIREVFDAIAKLEEKKDDEKTVRASLTNQEKVRRLNEILSSEITDSINDNVLYQLVQLPKDIRESGKNFFIKSLTETMNNGVRTENIQSARAELKQDIKYSELSEDIKSPLTTLSEFAIVENSFYDPDTTMNARKEAASSVDPVVIRAGDIIVREGQTITTEIYEDLKLAGLLNEERNIYPVLGLIILIFLILGVIAHEMNLMNRVNKLDKGTVISIILISVIVVLLMKITSLFTTQTNQFFFVVPIATGSLLIKQLISERFAIVLAALYAILGSIIFNGEIPGSLNVEVFTYFFLSQIAAVIFLRNIKDRLAIVRAGFGMAIVNVLIVFSFIFLSFEKYSLISILTQSSFAVSSALLSAILTLGLLPFFETSLGILSDIKLLALSNPNQPLLRRLLVEAPGTYHHSVMVANLSEAACETIGANGLLARVGSYYHDIGKTLHPHYFIENQVSIQNPHDFIDPLESAEIIINHPYDGAAMLKKHRLPKEIIDIAMEHHGTTLLKFFYYKEKEINENVKESDFRYPGPKPQSKEAAIICICDSVEAAVRSLKEPTKEKIDEIVSNIINDRLMDGQLDETPLTLQELTSIQKTINETLKGIFHSRIQYPTKEGK